MVFNHQTSSEKKQTVLFVFPVPFALFCLLLHSTTFLKRSYSSNCHLFHCYCRMKCLISGQYSTLFSIVTVVAGRSKSSNPITIASACSRTAAPYSSSTTCDIILIFGVCNDGAPGVKKRANE